MCSDESFASSNARSRNGIPAKNTGSSPFCRVTSCVLTLVKAVANCLDNLPARCWYIAKTSHQSLNLICLLPDHFNAIHLVR